MTLPTFGEAAAEVHAQQVAKWKASSGYHDNAAQWLRSLERHCASIWNKPLDQVKRRDALDCLQGIWNDKPNIARRVRQRARQVFSYYMAILDDDELSQNPFGENLDGALDVINKVQPQRNHAALDWQYAPAFWAKLATSPKPMATVNLIRFVMLTGVRVSEARLMQWAELDGDTWVVPAERTKMGREHRVPLSRQAAALVRGMVVRAKAIDSPLVFPNSKGKPIHLNTPLAAVKALDPNITVHGFRATLRSWLADQGHDWGASEACLAHRVGNKVEARYIRTDYYEARTAIMQQWADYLTGETNG